jgi:hypothetical protein
VLRAGSGLLDHQEFSIALQSGALGDDQRALRGRFGRELAAGKHEALQLVLLAGVEQDPALLCELI